MQFSSTFAGRDMSAILGRDIIWDSEAFSVSKYVRISPSKIRRILRYIEGEYYSEALLILKNLPYASCYPVIKTLRSAAANALNSKKFKDNPRTLRIKSAFVNKGPTMKRFRSRAQGRSYGILKKTSHITIVITQ